MLNGNLKAQAAVDFITSYGIALIIILASVGIIYSIGISNAKYATPTCNSAPGFSCAFFSMSVNGILTLKLAQALGSQLTINGIACSTGTNTVGNKPLYGNIYVTNSVTYYPPSNDPGSNTIYSNSYYIFYLYCYSSSGIATSSYGNWYSGYVWFNYSIPGYGGITERVVQISAPYSKTG